jgi:hypothetical protein
MELVVVVGARWTGLFLVVRTDRTRGIGYRWDPTTEKKSYLLFRLENERLIISEKRDVSNSRQLERFLILIN